jgi:hypothetical protein
VSRAALQIYRRYVGAYYRKVKPPEVPLWKYLSEMWESIPQLPESARLKVWREKRGRGRKRRVVETAPQRAGATRTIARRREQQVAEVGPMRFVQHYTTAIDRGDQTATGAGIGVPAQTGTANQLFHWDTR